MYDSAKPERVLFLKGDLLDENGNLMNDVEIEIKNIKTQKVKKIKVRDGTYAASLTLSNQEDVLVTIKKEGFAFNSQYISYNDSSFLSPKKLDFELKNIIEGQSFLLNNIYFDLDSYEINEVSERIIVEFSEYLKVNSGLIISINGYTDDIGESIYNQKLSENRALSVYNSLIKNGIPSQRLEFKGYGEQNPKNNNLNEKERALNRRTEFYVIKK